MRSMGRARKFYTRNSSTLPRPFLHWLRTRTVNDDYSTIFALTEEIYGMCKICERPVVRIEWDGTATWADIWEKATHPDPWWYHELFMHILEGDDAVCEAIETITAGPSP